MKAIVVEGDRKAPSLRWKDLADLRSVDLRSVDISHGEDEVLVAVKATAVNRADLAQARGAYPPPPGASPILGLEMAGIIEAVGSAVTGWRKGDRVCALLPGGGYAEKAAVPGKMLLRLPDDWSFAQGAAVPEVWFTAFVNLFLEAGLQAGEIALIHAGGSGVGTAAIQLARIAGARAFVTTGTAGKVERCRALGAELAINYKERDFLSELMMATDGEGVDVILDPVGGAYLSRNIQALRPFGRLVNIGTLSGGVGEMDVSLLLRKRLRIIGSTLRTRPVAEKIEITRQFEERFWPHFATGELQTVIDTEFPIERAQDAHAYVAENRNFGKVILTVD